MKQIVVSVLVFAGWLVPVWSQTAEDLLNQGQSAYLANDYPQAEQKFQQFLTDYGNAVEAKPQRERVQALLALAQIQQQKYEAAEPVIKTYLASFPEGAAVEELGFWEGICLFKNKAYDASCANLQSYLTRYPRSSKQTEVRMTMNASLLLGGKWNEAADGYGALAESVPPREASRARTFQLYALSESNQNEKALALVRSLAVQIQDADSIALFHLLALRVGDALMEREQWHSALTALQRVWPKERIVQRQEARRDQCERERSTAEKEGDKASLFQRSEVLAQIHKEIDALKKIPDYDEALQLRVARCFYQLQRYRECSLVLSAIQQKLTDGPLSEQAAFLLVTSYLAQERWREGTETADRFVHRFPKSAQVPQALALLAEARQKQGQFAAAVEVHRQILKEHPESPLCDRSTFFLGYDLLMLEKNEEAVAAFADYGKKYPQGPLREAALYWTGMAHSFSRQYELCRETLAKYLKQYPGGAFQEEAVFRRAHCLYAGKNFSEAYHELESFIQEYPGSARTDEAHILLGDSYFALAEIDRGTAAFLRVSPTTPRLYEYAYFQIGKAYRLTEQFDALLAHYLQFVREHGTSPRVVEALRQIAFVYRQQEQPEKAQAVYWGAVNQYGNDPEQLAVEDVLTGLAKLYAGPEEKLKLHGELRDLAETAGEKKQPTLAARACWMQAQLLQRENPDQAKALLVQASEGIKPEQVPPRLLADMGDALRESGRTTQAKECYEGLLAYYPRALQKDRSFAGLGLLAVVAGRERAALDYFEQFEREAFQSPLLPQVLKARAQIYLMRGDHPKAVADFEKILKVPQAKGLPWVEALSQIGDCYIAMGKPDKAVPYYQRIYIMYGRWPNYVAKAYWQSGQAFEKLHLRQEARNTYQEMIGHPELEAFEEFDKARSRLKEMGI